MKNKHYITLFFVLFYTLSTSLTAKEYTNTSYYVAYDSTDTSQFALILPSVNKIYTHQAGHILPSDLTQVDTQFATAPTYKNGEVCFSSLSVGASGKNGASIMANQCYTVNFFYTQKELTSHNKMAFILTYIPTDTVYEGLAGDASSFKVVKKGTTIQNFNSSTYDNYSQFSFDISSVKVFFGDRGDITRPIITLLGTDTVLTVGDNYIDAGATAIDNIDGNISSNITKTGRVNTAVLGMYTLHYNVLDTAGNVAIPRIRTVTVISNIPTIVTDSIAQKFLLKSTFGADKQLINDIKNSGIETWLDNQFNMSSAYDSPLDEHYTYLERTIDIFKKIQPENAPSSIADYVNVNNAINFNQTHNYRETKDCFTSTWFENALDGKDQLRQRMAYALSQILVISDSEIALSYRGEAFSTYYDILVKHAFGNYRDLLFHISKSPAMGLYLTFRANKKYDPTTQRQPDENYARELMQLFSIGLNRLNPDGTSIIDGNGKTIATYTQHDVEELSRVFTGWELANIPYYGKSRTNAAVFTKPMEFTAEHHDFEEKTVLGTTISGTGGDDELYEAIDILMNYPTTAPFVSKFLIQRFVTSNPTPAYVQRVSAVFRDNGQGECGDMKSVLKAILLDQEVFATHDADYFAKAKEPLLAYIQMLRVFNVDYSTPWPGDRLRAPGKLLTDIYFFKKGLPDAFGQGPLMAPSVFNFYQSDFIINDTVFKAQGKVTPELQIQSPQQLINYSNKILETTQVHERFRKQSRLDLYGIALTSGVYDRFTIGFDEEVALLKTLFNDDYTQLNKSPYKENAVDALVDALNQKLTYGEMHPEEVATLKIYLKNKSYGTTYEKSQKLIYETVTAIVTSKSYMIQK